MSNSIILLYSTLLCIYFIQILNKCITIREAYGPGLGRVKNKSVAGRAEQGHKIWFYHNISNILEIFWVGETPGSPIFFNM